MSIAAAANTAKAGANSTDAITTPANATFVVCAGWYADAGQNLTSVSDSKTNAYTIINTVVGGGDPAFKAALYYSENGTGGASHTFSLNFSAATNLRALFAVAITGGLTSGILDQAPTGNHDAHSDATPYVTTISGTTTQANELVLAFGHTYTNAGTTETHSWNNSYTGLDTLTDLSLWTGASSYKLLSATGTQQASLNASGGSASDAIMFLATFKEAAGGVSGIVIPTYSSYSIG